MLTAVFLRCVRWTDKCCHCIDRPFVNCPWSEGANQLGLSETNYKGGFSPHRMRSEAYSGLVGSAGLPNLIFFDYFTDTEDALLHEVGQIAREMADLKSVLLAPLTMSQPSVHVENSALLARCVQPKLLVSVEPLEYLTTF